MQIGQIRRVHDPVQGLLGEAGKFEVTTPSGEIFLVECSPGHSISQMISLSEGYWTLRKVAEDVPTQPTQTQSRL